VNASAEVVLALEGRCVVCKRRLPKNHIAIYRRSVTEWTKGKGSDVADVELCACGERCLARFNEGEPA
jgi:hypothetical protein